eukprot:TRINITY_DN14236_c0_g1_i1.p1 TRINITY_DN14236_c0_g1~~TRINITY_DN14236_c0_g1_i1.p1  ORF type:complete len:269 (-),score=69.42 TRINITY_DN14236_c0_g1_i1:265-1071(-)
MSSCSVRVVARFRPFNEIEKRKQDQAIREKFELHFPDETAVEVKIDKQNHNFAFDKVYDTDSIQCDVYEFAAKPVIDDILTGYNGTIFAYGQTGSGKTFTMFGVRHDPELKGIIPRASSQMFQHIDNDDTNTEYAIKCSFLEIYKERIRDLLNPASQDAAGLKIRESPQKGVWIEGLTEEFISSEEEIEELIALGEKCRSVAYTDMNATSSRSHSVFMITIEQKLEDGSQKSGKLNLVDLAGSERIAKTNASGKQLEEAKMINKSLPV